MYSFKEIEKKWLERWKNKTLERENAPKYYVLEMFPYPSGRIHMGHVRNYSIGDVLARYLYMKGYSVLHPMGWDSFGLPAENAAMERGVHPADWTKENINYMKKQLQRLGFAYNWDREISTCEPDYYKWNQWIFLKMFEKGLAYRKSAPVNWCPRCQTVLANEQVIDGKCWRCGTEVTTKKLEQWFLKITAYAERLLEDMKYLEGGWPQKVLIMQRNWIGKSEGVEADFEIPELGIKLRVFTTRADTLFGCTFVVLAPEHPVVDLIIEKNPDIEPEVSKLRMSVSVQAAEMEKKGVFTGFEAINPVNGERVPVWVANYVLMEYGTGAIMAVPAHDQRDFEFAEKYGLPIKIVIVPEDNPDALKEPLEEAYEEKGILVNSGPFTGMKSDEAIEKIAQWLSEKGLGGKAVNYRLKDWLISRQRYWGTPIPVVYCEKCGVVPVPEDELPVMLPRDVEITGKGESPLAKIEEFVKTKCPKCGGEARRETDTMDTFFDSSWYFLRFISPKSKDAPFDSEEVKKWMPVDQYIGGVEHAILHLMYARFFQKFLYDLGLVKDVEPFKRLLTQGMVLKDGAKMSKSRGNVVDPDEMLEKYGADAVRLFILFAAPPERDLEWSDAGIEGASRFLNRVWRIVEESSSMAVGQPPENPEGIARRILKSAHKATKKVTNDIEKEFQFNTAIAALMTYVNELYSIWEEREKFDDAAKGAWREALKRLALLLAPFTPFIAEELWEKLGGRGSVFDQGWPSWDEKLLQEDVVTYIVQVNGKVRGRVEVSRSASKEEVLSAAREVPNVAKFLKNKQIVREIFVPGKLVNFVVK